jgi:predicted ArsR family transcriptional regulator
MQETRRLILEILKRLGSATIEQLVTELKCRRGDITPVTVRHHLNRLQEEGFVAIPQVKHRSRPGRPQHTYMLTQRAEGMFHNNYQQLAIGLVTELKEQFPPERINVILEGVADGMAKEACIYPQAPIPERLDAVVAYLNQHGYEAEWQRGDGGFILRTRNCPYHHLAHQTEMTCHLDMLLVSRLLGVVPRLLSRVSEGDDNCAYWIPA